MKQNETSTIWQDMNLLRKFASEINNKLIL